MFCSSSEEMVVSFTIISKVAVITQVSINKKGADPLLGVSLNLNKMFNLRWDQKLLSNCKNVQFYCHYWLNKILTVMIFYREMEEQRLTVF